MFYENLQVTLHYLLVGMLQVLVIAIEAPEGRGVDLDEVKVDEGEDGQQGTDYVHSQPAIDALGVGDHHGHVEQ